jgi:hypothetical protein
MLPLTVAPGNVCPMPPPASDPQRLITCRCGVRPVPIPRCVQNQLWVRSPKTGREIVIGDGFFAQLRERAPRLVSRITKACSQGRSTVDLSIAELQAVADVAKIIADATKPLPVPPGGWNRRYKRRPWGA